MNLSERFSASPGEQGYKRPIEGMRAACSADHPAVVATIERVLNDGGNAVDAAIAASLLQTALSPLMTNSAGTVTFLYWDAADRRVHQMNSMGTLAADLPPFQPVPQVGAYAPVGGSSPSACLPGFMPGLAQMYERFGSLPWARLCEDAIEVAEQGHVVSSFEYGVTAWSLPFVTYFPEGRELFCPLGYITPVGQIFRNPAYAQTLRRVAVEGPEWMISGGWAQAFVARGNELGWPVTLAHMKANPPRWGEPMRFRYRDCEIVQLAPPERQGLYCALVLGTLQELGYSEMGHLSGEALHAMGHVLRWAERDLAYLHDPVVFDVPADVWLDPSYHRHVAKIIASSRPRVDVSRHMELTRPRSAAAAAGMLNRTGRASAQPFGSCELSVVDKDGNWVQMMNTLQGGGIPGMVVEGVPMVGSSALLGHLGSSMLGLALSAWLVPGSRIRSIIGNSFVFRDDEPWLALGTPGKPDCGTVQVLSHILDRNLSPYEAVDAPRMQPLAEDYSIAIEDRLPEDSRQTLWSMGIRVQPMLPYEWHMGSFQVTWRGSDGLLGACADPRRGGAVGGIR